MRKPQRHPRRYEVMRYDGHEVTVETLDASSIRSLDPRSYDHYMSSVEGVMGYRDEAGEWTEHVGNWPGLGEVSLRLLQALQLNPGDFLPPRDLVELTGLESLRHNDNVAARICSIRHQTHSEAPGRFIETRRAGGYALRWRPDRTWLWVDRAPTPGNG